MKAGSLGELAALRAVLAERRRAVEEQLAAEREQAARERRERSLFAATVGAVVPLRRPAAAVPPRPRPAPRARQRERDDAAVLVEALSDGFDVESLLETDDSLSFRRRGVALDVVRKLRRGVWVLQGELDLHGLRRDEARERLAEFLRQSTRSGARCVRIVHGKGHGSPGREPVLKDKVKSWLVQRSEVLAFAHARAADGGNGALIVLLEPGAERRLSPPDALPRR
ncbi:MAG: Smr/MutS family protein [Caldimonas sp.]